MLCHDQSIKVSKKARQREQKQLHKDHQAEANVYDPRQPPTDY
jgi:hypothetical protein